MDQYPSQQSPSTPEQAQGASSPELSPVMQAVEQPKKKSKTGLIIGIVVGSLVLLGLIALALWYFLVWQHPQNVLSRAVAKSFTQETSVAQGKITAEADGMDMTIDFKGATNQKKGKIDATMSVNAKGVNQAVKVSFEGIAGDDGALYFKADGIKAAVDQVFEASFKENMLAETTPEQRAFLNTPEGKAYVEQMKKTAMEQFTPVIDAVDGEWVKVTPADLMVGDTKDARCAVEMLRAFQSDTTLRQQIARLYERHPFYTVSGDVEAKQGMKGYRITIDSEKARAFGQALRDDILRTQLRGCDTDEMFDTSKDYRSGKDADYSFKIWLDGSETVRSIEMSGTSDEAKMVMQMDIEYGKTESIDVPSQTKTMKELQDELSDLFEGTMLPFQALSA